MPASFYRDKRRKRNPWQVVWRRGGRDTRTRRGGQFAREADAKARAALINFWLARGLDPTEELRKLRADPPKLVTLQEAGDAYLEKRSLNARLSTLSAYRARFDLVCRTFGRKSPREISVNEIQSWIWSLARTMEPSSVKKYLAILQLVLDDALPDDIRNPARSKRVFVPRGEKKEQNPPTVEQFRAILHHLPNKQRYLLPLLLQERTGTRPGEWGTVTAGDVDRVERRALIRSRNEKTHRTKWVDVPPALWPHLLAVVPDEPHTLIFPGLTTSAIRNALYVACKAAKIPIFSGNDLRHRRQSLWHLQGVPAAVIASRVGHRKVSTGLDHYTHVTITAEELPDEEADSLLLALKVAPVNAGSVS